MMTQFYTRDVPRHGQEKLPPMPVIYLYPEARTLFPELPSQSIASLENANKKKYRALRYKLIWLSNIALPNFRYPTPFPIPAQGWSGEIVDQRPIVSMRIGDKRWLLRLRGGARFRRQVSAFREMTNDTAVPGEAA